MFNFTSLFARENNKKKFHGKGKMVWPNGEMYEGLWKNNERSGKGRNLYHNGDIYEGEFVKGHKHGNGVYIYHYGARYEG